MDELNVASFPASLRSTVSFSSSYSKMLPDEHVELGDVPVILYFISNRPVKIVSFQVFASYLQFCGIGLRNAQLYEKSQLEVKRNQVLLDLARMIFEEQSTIEHMVLRILTHMQSLIQCQRVQVKYLLTRHSLS